MSRNLVPSLDSAGWSGSVAQGAKLLLEYYIVTDKSQSTETGIMVSSLTDSIGDYGNNKDMLRSVVTRDLDNLYSKYFDSIEIDVVVAENPEQSLVSDVFFDISIDIVINDSGRQYSLGRLITVINNEISKVLVK